MGEVEHISAYTGLIHTLQKRIHTIFAFRPGGNVVSSSLVLYDLALWEESEQVKGDHQTSRRKERDQDSKPYF